MRIMQNLAVFSRGRSLIWMLVHRLPGVEGSVFRPGGRHWCHVPGVVSVLARTTMSGIHWRFEDV